MGDGAGKGGVVSTWGRYEGNGRGVLFCEYILANIKYRKHFTFSKLSQIVAGLEKIEKLASFPQRLNFEFHPGNGCADLCVESGAFRLSFFDRYFSGNNE